jgi:hypothetical protein
MIDLNPDIVCSIIAKAREFHAKEEVVIAEEPDSPSDDWALQVLADHSDDLTYQELKAAIDELEPDQQITLVALMWVGRGDFDVEEWEAALQEASDSWTDYTAEYLLARPLVADYLEEGLVQHGYSCNE